MMTLFGETRLVVLTGGQLSGDSASRRRGASPFRRSRCRSFNYSVRDLSKGMRIVASRGARLLLPAGLRRNSEWASVKERKKEKGQTIAFRMSRACSERFRHRSAFGALCRDVGADRCRVAFARHAVELRPFRIGSVIFSFIFWFLLSFVSRQLKRPEWS